MRLTEKKAIQITIELWEWLAKTGSFFKSEWPKWKEYGEMDCACPLCEYDIRKSNSSCSHCPLTSKFLSCFEAGFQAWVNTDTAEDRRIYASKFLEQLKQL